MRFLDLDFLDLDFLVSLPFLFAKIRAAFLNGDLLPDSGKPQSPNIKIRAGQGVSSKIPNRPILENINIDGSSLYLTTNEAVPLKHHASKVKDLTPKFFDGKQIVLNY